MKQETQKQGEVTELSNFPFSPYVMLLCFYGPLLKKSIAPIPGVGQVDVLSTWNSQHSSSCFC